MADSSINTAPQAVQKTTKDELFLHLVASSGMPTTEAGMKQEWEALNKAEGSLIRNDSSFSPFWRMISQIVTSPAKWLVNLLVQHVLPNTFVRFASGVWLDVLCWGVDIERKGATPATGRITFTRSRAVGDLLIPAGTGIKTPPINGIEYRMFTIEDTIIPDGVFSLAIAVQAETTGEAYNLGAGYYSFLLEPISGIQAVSNETGWLEVPGADQEADDAFRLRYRNQFQAVGQLHHDAAYKVLIAAFTGLRMDYIVFEKDGPRGPGTANGYVMIESGVPPKDYCDAINKYIRESGYHGHGDDILIMPIKQLPIKLSVTVYAVEGAGEERREKLRTEVENRIRYAFRDNMNYTGITRVLPLSRFSFSQLSDELHSALPDLKSVEYGRSSDIVAQLELPVLESISITLG